MSQSIQTAGAGRPKVLVFCTSAPMERVIRESLAGQFTIRSTDKWSDVEAEAAASACVVAVVPRLRPPDIGEHLEAVRTHAPETLIVVVTTRTAENAEAILRIPVDAVVWETAVREQLLPAVVRVLEHSYLAVVARNALREGTFAHEVRIAIAAACRSHAPPYSVERSAMACGVPRSTLNAAWRKAGAPRLSPKLYLRWIRLLQAVAWKTAQRSWESIAAELHVDVDTLARDATKVAGLHLRDLSVETIGLLREKFEDSVLRPLGIPAPPAKMR